MRQVGEDFDDSREARLDDEVDEADLTLGDVRRLSVVELADGELVLLLQVALLEKLNEDEVGPQAAQVPRLRRVRDVGQVEHEADEELLIFGTHRVEVIVSHPTVQVTQLRKVLRHVSCKYCLNDHLPDSLEVSARHAHLPVAILVARHQLERCRQMVILEHAHIVVPHRNLVVHVNQEDIVDAWVLEIVQGCTYVTAHLLEVVKFNLIFDSTIDSKVVKGLADIRSVRLVVVSDNLVPSCQTSHEAHEVCKVYVAASDQAVLGENPGQDHCEFSVVRVLPQLENVEIVTVYFSQLVLGLRTQLKHLRKHYLRQLSAQFREDCLGVLSLVVVHQTVVLESACFRSVCELSIPSFHHFGLHVRQITIQALPALVVIVIFAALLTEGTRNTLFLREALVVGALEILLVQLVRRNHLDAVLECHVGSGIVIDSLLDLTQLSDDFLLHGDEADGTALVEHRHP